MMWSRNSSPVVLTAVAAVAAALALGTVRREHSDVRRARVRLRAERALLRDAQPGDAPWR